jgi:hypothetical protein
VSVAKIFPAVEVEKLFDTRIDRLVIEGIVLEDLVSSMDLDGFDVSQVAQIGQTAQDDQHRTMYIGKPQRSSWDVAVSFHPY